MKIERHNKPAELGKRCQVPFILTETCSCGYEIVINMIEDGFYLSYPVPGREEAITFECGGCNQEFTFKAVFDVSLELVKDPDTV